VTEAMPSTQRRQPGLAGRTDGRTDGRAGSRQLTRHGNRTAATGFGVTAAAAAPVAR